MDITTFYGQKNQLSFYVENNGANPITVTSIDLVNETELTAQDIYTEIENTFPITVVGNSQLDVFTDYYSLNPQSCLLDLTYLVTYNVIDMSDFTTIIETTSFDMTFDFSNYDIFDATNHSILAQLNKHFHVGPSGPDATISLNSFTSTGLPILEFDDAIKYAVFLSTCQPQFAVLNNTITEQQVLVGSFYFNTSNNSLEVFFTEEERTALVGSVFNNIYFFFTCDENTGFQTVTEQWVTKSIRESSLRKIDITNISTGEFLKWNGKEQINTQIDFTDIQNTHIGSEEFDVEDSTIEIDFETANTYYGVLSDTTQSVIFKNLREGYSYKVVLIQDQTGSCVVSDQSATDINQNSITIKWAGGSEPTLTATADKADIISCLYAGGILYADITKNF